MSADTFKNFGQLKLAKTLGTDYNIDSKERFSDVLILTPHGGGIETGCSELAYVTAKDNDFNYYAFEGWKSSDNGELHITSTNFDEPTLLGMLPKNAVTVAYHGYYDNTNKHTKIGGRNEAMKKEMKRLFDEAGISSEILPSDDPIAGVQPENIVNMNKHGEGLQLELSTAQRNAFFGTNTRAERLNTITDEFKAYVALVARVAKGAGFSRIR